LGIYPEVSLKDARDRRDEVRKLLAKDIDPSGHRKANKDAQAELAASSFETFALEWCAKVVGIEIILMVVCAAKAESQREISTVRFR
jgi:hypothetical protein